MKCDVGQQPDSNFQFMGHLSHSTRDSAKLRTRTPLACPVCSLPLDAFAMTMTGQINGHHFITAFCSRCAKRLATLPESARRRLCLVAERRIAKVPKRYPVRVCASEFEARALQALADDPSTFEQVQGIIIGSENCD